jgi:hypothetical protein
MNELEQEMTELNRSWASILELVHRYVMDHLASLEVEWSMYQQIAAENEARILKRSMRAAALTEVVTGLWNAGARKPVQALTLINVGEIRREALKGAAEKIARSAGEKVGWKVGREFSKSEVQRLPSSYSVQGVGFWAGMADEYRRAIDQVTQTIEEFAQSPKKSTGEEFNIAFRAALTALDVSSPARWAAKAAERWSESELLDLEEERRSYVRGYTLRKNSTVRMLHALEKAIAVASASG